MAISAETVVAGFETAGCCSSKKDEVKVSKEWKAKKKEQKKLVLSQLHAADVNGDGLDQAEMKAFLLKPDVVTLLDQLAGGSTEGHADLMAQTLMAKHDTDRSGTIDRVEGKRLQHELDMCITEPFYVFTATGTVQPGGLVWGMVVLQLETPLAASAISVSLTGKAECHFTVPKTHYRTVRTKNGTRRERYTVHHPRHATETFVTGTQHLFQPPAGVLAPGLHRFRFSFAVPSNVPFSSQTPSVMGKSPNGNGEGSRGRASISYRVVAHTAVAPGMTNPEVDCNPKTSKPTSFMVGSPASPLYCTMGGPDAATHTSSIKAEPCFCCCCMNGAKLPRCALGWTVTTPTGLYSNEPRLPMVAPGDSLGVAVVVENTHSFREVKKASMTTSFKVEMSLRAGGSTWSGHIPAGAAVQSAKVDIKAGASVRLAATPVLQAPVFTGNTKPVSFATIVKGRLQAASGSCASWSGDRMLRRPVVAVPAWITPPVFFHGEPSESKQEGPPPPPAKTVDPELDSKLFGDPVAAVTKTNPAGGVRSTVHHGGAGGAVPSAPVLNDVYTYPTPAPFQASTQTTLQEDEEAFDHNKPVSFLV